LLYVVATHDVVCWAHSTGECASGHQVNDPGYFYSISLKNKKKLDSVMSPFKSVVLCGCDISNKSKTCTNLYKPLCPSRSSVHYICEHTYSQI
jgi:hypothetical protein